MTPAMSLQRLLDDGLGGRYSFNPTSVSLFQQPGTRVVNPRHGVQMRAFAVGTSVNLDPASSRGPSVLTKSFLFLEQP
jgi:hypothetical protein